MIKTVPARTDKKSLSMKQEPEALIKRAARFGLVRIGKLVGFLLPRANKSGLFFFFPFYGIGGAEKVHAQIVACFKEQKAWVFFTNKSGNGEFRFLFESGARLFDISRLIMHLFTYYLTLGALTTLINRHANAVVFGCNNVFFYHLISYLRRDVYRADLVHCFGGGIEHVSLPFVHQIDARVVIDNQTLIDLKNQYARYNIDSSLGERLMLIENCVAVPGSYPAKQACECLTILYVGRGENKQKRVYLIGRTAGRCREMKIPVRFVFVGDAEHAVEAEYRDACIFKGAISDAQQLNDVYATADAIVLTSSFEGFPMVVMEAMAYGVVPISTPVGGIPFHVKDGINGLLIDNSGEDEIVDSLVEAVRRLAFDRALLHELSQNAYDHARAHFDSARFCSAYRKLVLEQ